MFGISGESVSLIGLILIAIQMLYKDGWFGRFFGVFKSKQDLDLSLESNKTTAEIKNRTDLVQTLINKDISHSEFTHDLLKSYIIDLSSTAKTLATLLETLIETSRTASVAVGRVQADVESLRSDIREDVRSTVLTEIDVLTAQMESIKDQLNSWHLLTTSSHSIKKVESDDGD